MQEQSVKEVVVIDDFSDTPFIPPNESDYTFILKLFRNKFSLGTSASRNLAVKNCTSDYILFLDDDDLFTKDKVKVLSDSITGFEDVIYHDFYSCYPDFGIVFPVKKKGYEEIEYSKRLKNVSLYNFVGGMPTICIKRDFFMRVGGFDESLPALEDWEFNIRCIRFNGNIRHIELPLTCCNYFLNRKSVSSALISNFRAYFLIDKKIKNIDSLLNRIRRLSCFFSTIGSAMRLRKKVLFSILFYFASFIFYPNIRCLLLFISSFFPIKLFFNIRKKYIYSKFNSIK
jgi:glycosyltransferase involved in cell wall biosynthesis